MISELHVEAYSAAIKHCWSNLSCIILVTSCLWLTQLFPICPDECSWPPLGAALSKLHQYFSAPVAASHHHTLHYTHLQLTRPENPPARIKVPAEIKCNVISDYSVPVCSAGALSDHEGGWGRVVMAGVGTLVWCIVHQGQCWWSSYFLPLPYTHTHTHTQWGTWEQGVLSISGPQETGLLLYT